MISAIVGVVIILLLITILVFVCREQGFKDRLDSEAASYVKLYGQYTMLARARNELANLLGQAPVFRHSGLIARCGESLAPVNCPFAMFKNLTGGETTVELFKDGVIVHEFKIPEHKAGDYQWSQAIGLDPARLPEASKLALEHGVDVGVIREICFIAKLTGKSPERAIKLYKEAHEG